MKRAMYGLDLVFFAIPIAFTMRCLVVTLVLGLVCLYSRSRGSDEIDFELVKRSVEEATQLVQARKEANIQEAFVNGTVFSHRHSFVNGTGSVSHTHCRGTKRTPESEEQAKHYEIYEKTVEILDKRYNVPVHHAHRVLRQATRRAAFCMSPRINCDYNSKYRTIDGSCNHMHNSSWGMAGTKQDRLLPARYEDGIRVPRGGFQSYLPNPRFVSTECHPDFRQEYSGITNMLPQFGQFLDHDISMTPEGDKPCCRGDTDPNCWNIQIPPNDPFYGPLRKVCMDFTRSTCCTNSDNGNREQINAISSFMDGSMIYGATDTRAKALRTFRGGQLLVNPSGSSILQLPYVSQTRETGVQGAFITGDNRANEMPALAVMHNLLLKEHNRIAAYFAAARPNWSDERCYQEARRIVTAQLQVITYNEFLPILLGQPTMDRYGLTIRKGQYSSYDPNINPSVLNEFSTAAFRCGHSFVRNTVPQIEPETRRTIQTYDIKDQYQQPNTLILDGGRGAEYTMTGLLESRAQIFDVSVVVGLTTFLNKQSGVNYGADLVARNIQRGRDHGLPPYNEYRTYCALPKVNSNYPPSNMAQGAWEALIKTYGIADHIDLFPGGLSEDPSEGSIIGPTFRCLLAIQFQRLKYGDRFFVTHGNQVGSFTPIQLDKLLSRRMSDICCNNGIQPYVQANAFLVPSPSNPRISCNDTSRKLNLEYFL